MGHTFQIPDETYHDIVTFATQHGQTPDDLLVALVVEAVEQLKQTDKYAVVNVTPYDPTNDPLASFIGAFDSGVDEPGWVERHDIYFAEDYGERYGNKE